VLVRKIFALGLPSSGRRIVVETGLETAAWRAPSDTASSHSSAAVLTCVPAAPVSTTPVRVIIICDSGATELAVAVTTWPLNPVCTPTPPDVCTPRTVMPDGTLSVTVTLCSAASIGGCGKASV